MTLDFFFFSRTYFTFRPFCTPTIPLHSLRPPFFISVPPTVPRHSKALLTSLTLFHRPADDNNWFENRRQWDTRIIPGSLQLPPTPHIHPARTSLLRILHSTSRPPLSHTRQLLFSLLHPLLQNDSYGFDFHPHFFLKPFAPLKLFLQRRIFTTQTHAVLFFISTVLAVSDL